jgi:hypothetical protein
MVETGHTNLARSQKSRAFWLKHLHQWHWMSAAVCLVGMLLFSVTGFTLNHATSIAAQPRVHTTEATLPSDLLTSLQAVAQTEGERALPEAVAAWLTDRMQVRLTDRQTEWSDEELYVSLPRPGGDAWLTIDLASGAITHEVTDRGWISYLNDLHKGRNTGDAWSLFIDVFAFATLIFAITGLLLLKFHATQRRATWPIVGFGLVLPLLLALLFVH